MPSTHALALWGAVTGTIGCLGGLVALLNFLRDRPGLRVTAHQVYRGIIDDREHRELVFEVVNNGRRPISITQGGIALNIERTGSWPFRREFIDSMYGAPQDHEVPARLDAWGSAKWIYRMGDLEDSPNLWNVFVLDSKRRYTWGAPSEYRLWRLLGRPRRSRSS
jgi:hypothetical protein